MFPFVSLRVDPEEGAKPGDHVVTFLTALIFPLKTEVSASQEVK